MRHYRKAFFVFAFLLAALVFWHYWGARTRDLSVYLLDRVRDMGPAAPVAFAAIYVLACLLGLPGSVLTLAGGFLFGVFWGTAIVSVSSTIGATAAFCVARFLLRGHVSRWTSRYPTISALDEAIASDGFKTVLLLRLSPLVPFNAFNYLMGVTRVSTMAFVLGSWLGMLPGTLMYVYAGSLVRDFSSVAAGHASGSVWRMAMAIVGFAATVYVTILITARARQSLAARRSAQAGKEPVPS